ncbi:MAG: DUF456 family protein [Candidatus Limimorpha sp.]
MVGYCQFMPLFGVSRMFLISKIPGPIAVFFATLIATLCLDLEIGWDVVAIVAVLVIASMIVSKLLVKVVKRLHEYSKRATWGTVIGSLIGVAAFAAGGDVDSIVPVILIALLAFVLLPFVFAFVFERDISRNGLFGFIGVRNFELVFYRNVYLTTYRKGC